MLKRYFLVILLFTGFISAKANHITGGEIYYRLSNVTGSNYNYNVTLKLYRDHFSTGAQLDVSAPIAIFDRLTGAMVWSGNIPLTFKEDLELLTPDPCISSPPTVYYDVGHYDFNVTLAANPNGYIIAYQRCCRIAGINNLNGSSSVGATYTAEIPGTSDLATAPANSSAHFIGPDTVIVCKQTGFTYSFNAMDPDGDSLRYSFCEAYQGAGQGNPAPNPPSGPPYIPVPYAFPFSGGSPMGSGVTINPATGVMGGIAPDVGIYVVTVCVQEFRNGILIATQRKDLQIKVGDCSVAAANIPPVFANCDSFTTNFANGGDQSLIHTYLWTFGDPSTGSLDTSVLFNPTHVFSDTGVYTVTLITNAGEVCSDTSTMEVRVFPGFFPGFRYTGICANKPTNFFDTTRSVYGIVNTWSWNFGDLEVLSDTSHLQNPTYTFPIPGTYNAQLIVTCSKGCIDTVTTPIVILDKPPLNVNPKDTIICVPDGVQIAAIGNGTFTWTGPNISNPNIANPVVSPTVTTWYHVQLNDNGCINNDSVHVRVVDHVTLNVQKDTTGCQNDPYQLSAQTDGTQHTWSPASLLDDPTSLTPTALSVPANTKFTIVSTIGTCHAQADVDVFVVPYPFVNLGNDTSICYNSFAQLHAAFRGTSFVWSPTNTLSNPNIPNPIATPSFPTTYTIMVFDTIGCPKPGKDTVFVNVRPKVNAFAGRDTAVVIGEPLHLNATGGVNYFWSPPFALSATNIPNPVALYDGSIDSIRYKVYVSDEKGCLDSANLLVKIYKTDPQVFVPTAFSPNGDGLNDVFRPIAVGIKKIEYFKVFNRWGQMVFSTTVNGQGWDGTISGKAQSTNTFVWIVRGIDYLDRPFFRKGAVTLIR